MIHVENKMVRVSGDTKEIMTELVSLAISVRQELPSSIAEFVGTVLTCPEEIFMEALEEAGFTRIMIALDGLEDGEDGICE